MTEISGFLKAKVAAAARIKEARERINEQANDIRAELKRQREYEESERVVRVAKALCAAGFHEWPLTDGTGSDYNNRQEQRYWLRLAVAAIQEIEHEP